MEDSGLQTNYQALGTHNWKFRESNFEILDLPSVHGVGGAYVHVYIYIYPCPDPCNST